MSEGQIIGSISLIVGLLLIVLWISIKKMKANCKVEVSAIYHDFSRQYTGKGISLYRPKFKYTYENQEYDCYSIDSYSNRKLNNTLTLGEIHTIYLNPKKPSIIYSKKGNGSTVLLVVIGVAFIICSLLIFLIT